MNRNVAYGMMHSDTDFPTGYTPPTNPRKLIRGVASSSPSRDADVVPDPGDPLGAAFLVPRVSGSVTAVEGGEDKKLPAKKKRKSPAVPWKKPVGMPKRPLSSYNLFFASEREKMIAKLSAGPEGGEGKSEGSLAEGEEETTEEFVEEGEGSGVIESPVASAAASPMVSPTGKGKKRGKKLGVGFANLAKIIAAKWKTLEPEQKAPFEKRASVDKQRYDAELAEWRERQKAEKKDEKKTKGRTSPKREAKHETLLSEGSPSLSHAPFPELSTIADPYPSDWFDVRDSSSQQYDESEAASMAPGQHHSPLRLGDTHYTTGYLGIGLGSMLPGIPSLQDRRGSGVQQPTLLEWGSASATASATSAGDYPLSISLEPRLNTQTQALESLAPHEFAQAFSGHETSRPPSTTNRYTGGEELRALESFSWPSAGNWAPHLGQPAYSSRSLLSSFPGTQYEPQPYDTTISVSQSIQYPRSTSLHKGATISDSMQQQPAGLRRHSEGGDPARSRQAIVPSHEQMQHLYNYGVLPPPPVVNLHEVIQQNLPAEPQLVSMIHNTQQRQDFLPENPSLYLPQQQQLASPYIRSMTEAEQLSTATRTQMQLTSTTVADPPHQQQEQQHDQPSASAATSTATVSSAQRLDDDTIDFITGLPPFP